MKICSFIQTCSDALLKEFVEHCERKLNKTLYIKKTGGRVELHHPTKSVETARGMANSIQREFNTF